MNKQISLDLVLSMIGNHKSLYPRTDDQQHDSAWAEGYSAAVDDLFSAFENFDERPSAEEEMDVVGAAVDADRAYNPQGWADMCACHTIPNQVCDICQGMGDLPEFEDLDLYGPECTCTDPGDPRCDAKNHKWKTAKRMDQSMLNPASVPFDFFGLDHLQAIDTELDMTYGQTASPDAVDLGKAPKVRNHADECMSVPEFEDLDLYGTGKEVEVSRGVTLTELAEEFNVDMDVIEAKRKANETKQTALDMMGDSGYQAHRDAFIALLDRVSLLEETLTPIKDLHDRSNGDQK